METNINANLKSRQLPAALIIKKFVKNDPDCNYEIYLRETLNASSYFKKLSNGEKYYAPVKENNKECDAITDRYTIDFKLIESSSYLQAKHLYSASVQLYGQDIVACSPSKKSGSTFVTKLHCALRDIHSFAQIESIINEKNFCIKMSERSTENMNQQLIYDLKCFYNNLKTDKNLLLFIPQIFYLENEEYYEKVAVEIIQQAITTDFLLSCQYRQHLKLAKDTFICCIYSKSFLVFKFERNTFLLVDHIPLNKIQSFMNLYRKYA